MLQAIKREITRRRALWITPFAFAGFHVKQHWHRKFHNDSRNKWLRKQVTELFNDETDEWR